MPKFRKRPVIIEAERFTGVIPDPCSIIDDPRIIVKADGSELLVTTLEGVMSAKRGDWIIRGVKGELYPCKPDIFEQTYEPAEEEQ